LRHYFSGFAADYWWRRTNASHPPSNNDPKSALSPQDFFGDPPPLWVATDERPPAAGRLRHSLRSPTGVAMMTFEDANADTCPRSLAMDVADELRAHIHDLYARQHQRNQETDGGMANVVLAGLTAVWLEAVHASWNTMLSESAMSVLRGMDPEDRDVKLAMKRAARDFLRRSGWWVRRTK